MASDFLLRLINFILPPRASERAVESLTLDELLTLQTTEGLPYQDERVRVLVWELKYHANRRAAALCGELMAEELLGIAGEELGRPLLIPVPMHKTRRLERGHNQTELLCEAALRHLGGTDKFSVPFDYVPHALARIRQTPEQQKLSRERRLNNLKNSMRASPDIVAGRVCVVVDDVKTTGATLAEAKRALLAAGAARVHTVALAQS